MSDLTLLDYLAESRIEHAIAQGMLHDLPGAGRPLVLSDDRLVPEELRAAYRMLSNAGCAPPEVDARREVAALVSIFATLGDDAARRRTLAKIALLKARLESSALRRGHNSANHHRQHPRLGRGIPY